MWRRDRKMDSESLDYLLGRVCLPFLDYGDRSNVRIEASKSLLGGWKLHVEVEQPNKKPKEPKGGISPLIVSLCLGLCSGIVSRLIFDQFSVSSLVLMIIGFFIVAYLNRP
jgi:hypothetical protein